MFEIKYYLTIRHFQKCLGSCRKVHWGPRWGPGGGTPAWACEKLAPVMGGIKVR